jgi:aryl-alcohol dehydrogenase-like predicted oxidoreductase
MMNRRQWLGLTAGASAALALNTRLLSALRTKELITRAVPSSGQRLPIVGLGSSATFAQVARSEDYSALRAVLRTMAEQGATVFDTAPSYGASEQVAGDIASELGLNDRIFWATKVNVAQGPTGPANPAQARQQIETSFTRLRKRPIDLIQVHNLGDVPTQLGILKELKGAGRVRYIGVTTTNKPQYEALERVMRSEPIDFIGIDYAMDNRDIEERILPLAQDRGIGVMVYMPFGRTRLWSRIGDRPLPDWAKEFDANSWAQFMIKYVASHPAVTVVTPATSKPDNMLDNVGAAYGRLPDAAMRRRMAAYADALPSAAAPAAPQQQQAPQGPVVVLSAAVLDRYVGEYRTAAGTVIIFRREGTTLFVKPGSYEEVALLARSETRLQDPRGPFFDFEVDGQGKVTGAILEQPGPQGPQRIPLQRR